MEVINTVKEAAPDHNNNNNFFYCKLAEGLILAHIIILATNHLYHSKLKWCYNYAVYS